MKKLSKKKRQRLLHMLCTGGIVLSTSLMPAPAEAKLDTITESQDYTESNYPGEIIDNIAIAKGHISYSSRWGTVQLKGNVAITQDASESYALFVDGLADGSGARATLKINPISETDPDKTKTVQISGNVIAQGHNTTDKEHGYDGTGYVELNLTNENSYLAGKMLLQGDAGRGDISMKLSDGAVWYVQQGDDSYSLATLGNNGIHLSANGGIIDLYHQSPNKVRTSSIDRSFTIGNAEGALNGATFAIASDIKNNQADSVTLQGVTGDSNTYYIQVVHDASQDIDGTYVGGATVLTTNNGVNDTVQAKPYKTEKDVAAGLLTKTLTITPTISTENGVTKLTAVQIEGNGSLSDGPGQQMANTAAGLGNVALSTWRLENNDLLRRMGDLRQEENSTGTWARIYGGETEINSSLSSTVQYRGIQAGYDRKVEIKQGKLFTGLALSHMDGDIASYGGKGDTDSTMFGIYGSYVGEKGHFADAIIKYGRMSGKMNTWSSTTNYESDTAANGLNMSIEYGYHKDLKDGWYIEPQAEINYGHINSNDYTMKMNGVNGAYVKNNAINSFIGRLGINAGKNTKNGNVYAKLSLMREFSGDTGVTTSYQNYEKYTNEDMKDTWFEYGIGFNTKLSKNNNLYGEITKTAGADKVTEKWKANLGYRHSF
ncbi:hypothetical protein SDC9_03957 [bioreactor metagenome]|uniref:Autotransporter domain-containing protein n=1 Tax=bioreactor metagenome TaxID=1076179 RepID=A0A644SUX7_9ZZZZ|nr:autotransporter outer membrane beta-barrel domain-containing protein [Negativicutes bacterium]